MFGGLIVLFGVEQAQSGVRGMREEKKGKRKRGKKKRKEEEMIIIVIINLQRIQCHLRVSNFFFHLSNCRQQMLFFFSPFF